MTQPPPNSPIPSLLVSTLCCIFIILIKSGRILHNRINRKVQNPFTGFGLFSLEPHISGPHFIAISSQKHFQLFQLVFDFGTRHGSKNALRTRSKLWKFIFSDTDILTIYIFILEPFNLIRAKGIIVCRFAG